LSRDIELNRLLREMDAAARGSEALAFEDPEAARGVTAWSDGAALRQIRTLIATALYVVGRDGTPQPAVVMTDPAPQSSVEIETLAKGGVKATVKVYAHSVEAAKCVAQETYNEIMAAYAEEMRGGTAT
jgi:hypothetical protein